MAAFSGPYREPGPPTDKYPPGYLEALRKEAEDMKTAESGSGFLQPEVKAPYKIEVQLATGRTGAWLKGLMICWESGKEFHGGGDLQMFICGYKDCNRLFPAEVLQGAFAVCPHCGRLQYPCGDDRKKMVAEGNPDGPVMTTHMVFSASRTDVADLVARRWVELAAFGEKDPSGPRGADIYLKFHRNPIQKAAKEHNMDKVLVARQTRELAIYPLARIIKDTSSGMVITTAIADFLKA